MTQQTGRPLRCRLGFHRPGRLIRARHLLHGAPWGLSQPGTFETYRCVRCGARLQRVSYARQWRLEDVLRRR